MQRQKNHPVSRREYPVPPRQRTQPGPARLPERFRRREIAPAELPWIMRRHILTGCLGSIMSTLLGGILFTWFGNTVGMTQFHWGVLSAIGSWVVLVQPFGALLGSRWGSRKLVWYRFAVIERVLRLVAIFGAFLAWRAGLPSSWVILVAMVSVANVAANLASPPWWGWVATIIPQRVQGAFWGRRDMWTSVAVAGVILPVTFLLDRIPAGAKPAAVFAVLAAAGVIGILDILLHAAIPEPPPVPATRSGTLDRVLKPARDRRFRPWLVFITAWNFGMSLGGSLCSLYFLDNLGLKDNLLGGAVALNVVGLVGSIVSARRMGRLVDRWGSRRILLIGHVGWAFLPLFWLFATPRTAVLWLSLQSLVSGVFATAASNAGMKLVTRFPTPEESPMYVAVSNSMANIAGGIGAFAAGSFLQLMGGWTAPVGRLTLSAFPLLFLASLALRLTSALVLVPRVRQRGMRDDERPMLLPLFFGLPVRRRRR
jgi:MFS family permease